MRRYITLPLLMLVCSIGLRASDSDAWITAGDRVRARSGPSVKAAIVAELKAGIIVKVMKKTDTRDRFLPNDDHGFFWYEAKIPLGKTGWIYGKYLYRMDGERFTLNPDLFRKRYTVSGKKYRFGIAVEDAYPVSDENGLTGSTIHALPYFLEEGEKGAVLLFKSASVRTFQDGDLAFPYYLRFYSSEGGIQKVSSVTVDGARKDSPVRVDVDFVTQEGGGNFFLTAKPEKDCLLITGYTLERETP